MALRRSRLTCTGSKLLALLQSWRIQILQVHPLYYILVPKMFGAQSERHSGSDSSLGYDDQERLLVEDERSSIESHSPKIASRGPSWIVACAAIVCTAVLSALLGAWAAQHSRLDADDFSIRHTSQYCKLNMIRLDAVPLLILE
jgi:hypothetical protein